MDVCACMIRNVFQCAAPVANKRAHLHHMMHAMTITQGQIIKGMANTSNTRPDWAMVFGIDFTAVFGRTIVLAARFVFGRRIVG